MPYPEWEPAPVAPRFHRFDPETRYTPENRGGVGWPGYFPVTPCRNCGCEFFQWVGDWNLGFSCAKCRRVWQPSLDQFIIDEEDAEARHRRGERDGQE